MADLDDFFAKKDKLKKKGKKGPKFSKANTDILAKNLEENDRKEENAEKKAAPLLATSEANRAGALLNDQSTNEDEWKDYEEEKKDFSNLEIGTLTIESDREVEEAEEHEINEETGEKVKVKKGDTAGPWNKIVGTNAAAKKEQSSQEKDETKDDDQKKETNSRPQPAAPSSYVPPHMRGGSSGSDNTERRPRTTRNIKNAPDLRSQINFPSLSDTIGPGSNDGPKGDDRESEKEFETARGGGSQRTASSEAPKLALDNKFSALRN